MRPPKRCIPCFSACWINSQNKKPSVKKENPLDKKGEVRYTYPDNAGMKLALSFPPPKKVALAVSDRTITVEEAKKTSRRILGDLEHKLDIT